MKKKSSNDAFYKGKYGYEKVKMLQELDDKYCLIQKAGNITNKVKKEKVKLKLSSKEQKRYDFERDEYNKLLNSMEDALDKAKQNLF